jgi:hypothetical protein
MHLKNGLKIGGFPVFSQFSSSAGLLTAQNGDFDLFLIGE